MPQLRQALSHFEIMASAGGHRYVKHFRDDIKESLGLLDRLILESKRLKDKRGNVEGGCASVSPIVLDLLANAVRRAEDGDRFDDAVARLYSAIEKMAKIALWDQFGLDNSDIRPEQLSSLGLKGPEEMRPDESGRITLPLHRSYELLGLLKSPLGDRYAAVKEELRGILNVRNMSPIAHGYVPIKQETFEKMLNIALGFIGAKKDELPEFPQMNWEGLGC